MIENATSETVDIEDVKAPNRDEKLHPPENEDEEEWEDFKTSVGTNPIYNPIAEKNGDKYEIIVGDRRLRAMKENGAEEIDLEVVDDASRNDIYTTRIAENSQRTDSDRFQKAFTLAQLCRPWLLEPAERDGDVEVISQTEAARAIGFSDGYISQLVNGGPLVDRRTLRHVLGQKGARKQLTEEEIEKVDNIVSLLKGSEGHKVMATGEEGWIADKLDSFQDVSLGEIEIMAERAVEEEWTTSDFLENLEEAYVKKSTDGVEPKVSSGPVAGDDPYADETPDQTRDEDTDAGPTTNEDSEAATETASRPDFGDANIEIDWDDLLDEDMLNGELGFERVGDITSLKWQDVSLQDDAAIMMNALAEATAKPGEDADEAKERVRENFLEQVFVEAGAKFLNENFEEEEVAPVAE